MATFVYTRVSTTDQSVEAQIEEIATAGYRAEHDSFVFRDVGVSGSCQAEQRPAFKQLLTNIRTGDTLVVQKLDRLGRDAIDVMQTVQKLAGRGIQVVCLNLGKTDLGSPAGKLMLTMLAAVAEMERDLIRERTKAGLEAAKARGVKLGGKKERQDADEIYLRAKAGESVTALSDEFGISRAGIYKIVNRREKSEA